MREVLTKYISRYYILFVIVALSFLIRLLFRSNYLDDWDSVQFALAIKDYSIVVHQPHPPGYPIYIFFGRIIDTFVDNPTKSLIFLSVLFGSLSIIPVYLLTEKFFNKDIATLSSIILSLTPAHLLFSEVAMTDIVSLFFVTTTIYLLYLGIEPKKYLYIGSFVLGITAGIRATDIILVFILFIVLSYRRKLKEFVLSTILMVVGILVWLIPIIIDTGFDALVNVEKSQFEYNKNVSTINQGLSVTLERMFGLFIDGWSYILYIFILITLIYIVLKIFRDGKINYISDRRFIFIAVWLLIYLVYSISNNDLYISRYLLPQFVPLSIIFACSMVKILDLTQKKPIKILFSTIFVMLIILMGSQAITGAYAISTTKPAPVQAAELIKKSYNPEDIIIVAKDSNRHFQYYLPNFTFLRFEDTPDKINNYINKTIISEGSPIAFVPSKIYTFKRPKIYPKHQYVLLYENKYLQNQFIMLEKDGWGEFGTFNNMVIRRMEIDAILRLYSGDNVTTNINFNIISFYRPRTLEIYNGENKINQINVTTEFGVTTMKVNLKKGVNVMRFHIQEGCERPIDHPELKSGDTRCMSVAFATEYTR